jgi:hypothetical protein
MSKADGRPEDYDAAVAKLLSHAEWSLVDTRQLAHTMISMHDRRSQKRSQPLPSANTEK